MQGPDGYFAYVIKPDGTAERRTVKLGGTQDGIAVILAGIAPGEQVAVEGQYRLTDGARAQIAPPSAAAETAANAPKAEAKTNPTP
jgi:multidrug efflux system membrane fusion protein